MIVDFHNTPSAFLPEDFELKPKQNLISKRRRMANRAGASEVSDVSDSVTTPRQMTPIGIYLDKSRENHRPRERYTVCQTPVQVQRPQSSISDAPNLSSGQSSNTASQAGRSQENMSPPTSHGPTKDPVKGRSLLFRFLAMVKE
jgi:hypothetical protein